MSEWHWARVAQNRPPIEYIQMEYWKDAWGAGINEGLSASDSALVADEFIKEFNKRFFPKENQ